MGDLFDTKCCTRCHLSKPLWEFYKTSKGGMYTYCKECTCAPYRKPPRTAEQEAAHQHKIKTNYNKRMAKYYGKHRGGDKINARATVGGMIQRGKIPPARELKCACGKQAQHYHHHLGYSREHRKDVIPLCAKCHKASEDKG